MLYETRNFTKAAEIIGTSQSVISRTIKEFEQALKEQLFDHNVRPIKPTATGKALYQLLIKELNSLDDQLGRLKTDKGLLAPLNIGFVESLARSMSWSILKDIESDYSKLTVLTGICPYLLSLLDRDVIEVFLSPDPFFHRNDLSRRFIFREPSILLVPKNSGIPAVPTWQQLQLCGLPMVWYHKANSGGNLDEKLFRQLGLQFNHRIEVDINALALDYIAQGAGWAITRPTALIQHPDLADQVDVRPMPSPVACRDLYVINRLGFNETLAEKIAASAVSCFVKKVVPKMVRKTPWIKPYLFIRGDQPDDRVPLFPKCAASASSDTHIL